MYMYSYAYCAEEDIDNKVEVTMELYITGYFIFV